MISTRRTSPWMAPLGLAALVLATAIDLAGAAPIPARATTVSIVGDEFHINGAPTYPGRTWQGHKIQGLLLNSRMVQGIFDDRNPATVQRWAYPDTQRWDPERNTREFVAAMPEWRRHGLLAFTINLQGGSPEGYSKDQPWHNSAIEADGSLRPDYLAAPGTDPGPGRRAWDGRDPRLFLFRAGRTACGTKPPSSEPPIWPPIGFWIGLPKRAGRDQQRMQCALRSSPSSSPPVHELIQRVQNRRRGEHRLLVSASYGGGTIPLENVVRTADFLLVHGNGVSDPNRIADMVRQTRKVPGYTPKPILFNEDDHFDFDQAQNNFVAAVGEYASWGYFDPGKNNYQDGYQSPPVNWGLNTERKRAFFELLRSITGVGSSGP